MKPILFSTPMVRAILTGTKSQTRRVVKEPLQTWMRAATNPKWHEGMEQQCPYGQPGDILWVREKFRKLAGEPAQYEYYADDSTEVHRVFNYKWKPSIHMPYTACRIWLRITNVRVERLQDISVNESIAEGIERAGAYMWKDYINERGTWNNPITSFLSLWVSINGRESWESNPFVWVVEFERTEKPITSTNNNQ